MGSSSTLRSKSGEPQPVPPPFAPYLNSDPNFSLAAEYRGPCTIRKPLINGRADNSGIGAIKKNGDKGCAKSLRALELTRRLIGGSSSSRGLARDSDHVVEEP